MMTKDTSGFFKMKIKKSRYSSETEKKQISMLLKNLFVVIEQHALSHSWGLIHRNNLIAMEAKIRPDQVTQKDETY